MRKKINALLAVGVLLVSQIFTIVTLGPVTSADPVINEYPTSAPDHAPIHITKGSDGNIWFSESINNSSGVAAKIARITPTGVVTEFSVAPLAATRSTIHGLTLGPDGNVWFTMCAQVPAPYTNYVGKITPQGETTLYTHVEVGTCGIGDISSGPGNKLWFIDSRFSTSVAVNSITTSGVITVNGAYSGLLVSIAEGSDNATWATSAAQSSIGWILPTGAITFIPAPNTSWRPLDIALGPDNAMWFTNSNGNSIGRVDTQGTITVYPLTGGNLLPRYITAGNDGAMWFTYAYNGANRIGRIAMDGTVTNYTFAGSTWGISRIVAGSDDSVWITQPELGQVARISTAPPDTLSPLVEPVLDPEMPTGDNGWYTSDVTVNWNVTDSSPSSGAPTQPPAIVASQEGEHTYTSAQSCDPVGNCATGSVTLKIDKSDPTISYSVAPAANNNGWQKDDVTVTFGCADAVSGIESCSSPVTITMDGQDQTVTGTAVDKAGRTVTTTALVSLDKTAPGISYTATPGPNANGWNNTDVAVAFVCTDALSAIESCIGNTTLTQEGANQTVTGTALDKAGNTSSLTTNAISIDKSDPTITYSVSPAANSNGQHNNAVTVTFSCADAVSGVDSCTAPVTLSTNGQNQTVTGMAVDKAGNAATVTATINIDTVAPSVSYSTNVTPNAAGWFNSDVLISWLSTDPSPSSGAPTQPTQTLAQQESTETYTSEQSCDPADNCATGTATLSIDKTNPAINYSVSSTANANGWNNGAVTISFTCADLISGIASCSAPVTLTNDGLGQTVTGTAVDVAGNVTTITVVVNIDSGNPIIVYVANPSANANGWNNTNVLVDFTCIDALSGIESCSNDTLLTTEGANQTRTGTALDKAGNTASITTAAINIDKTKPTTTNAAMSSTLVIGAQQVTITANAVDGLSGVLNGEYYVDTDPGVGNGIPMTLNGSTLSTQATFTNLGLGFHTVYVRSQDKAGNYSTTSAVTFLRLGGILPPLL